MDKGLRAQVFNLTARPATGNANPLVQISIANGDGGRDYIYSATRTFVYSTNAESVAAHVKAALDTVTYKGFPVISAVNGDSTYPNIMILYAYDIGGSYTAGDLQIKIEGSSVVGSAGWAGQSVEMPNLLTKIAAPHFAASRSAFRTRT